jgi:DNA-binding response OmpR family regulator
MEEFSHKILIVDDELNIQSLVSEALTTKKRSIRSRPWISTR